MGGSVEDALQRLGELAEQARRMEQARPESSAGRDESGAVQVVCDAGGWPVEFRIAADWSGRTRDLGASVVAACVDAFADQQKTWAQALAVGRRGEQAQGGFRGIGIGPQTVRNPQPSSRAATGGQRSDRGDPEGEQGAAKRVLPRTGSLADVAEAVLALPDPVVPDPSAEVTGSARTGSVKVTADSMGVKECVVDGRWAARQSAGQLTGALAEAVADAASRLPVQVTQHPGQALQIIGYDGAPGQES